MQPAGEHVNNLDKNDASRGFSSQLTRLQRQLVLMQIIAHTTSEGGTDSSSCVCLNHERGKRASAPLHVWWGVFGWMSESKLMKPTIKKRNKIKTDGMTPASFPPFSQVWQSCQHISTSIYPPPPFLSHYHSFYLLSCALSSSVCTTVEPQYGICWEMGLVALTQSFCLLFFY